MCEREPTQIKSLCIFTDSDAMMSIHIGLSAFSCLYFMERGVFMFAVHMDCSRVQDAT